MIDPTFRDELMNALGTAVSAYNADGNPVAAVVKAARAHEFNVEQTRRLVETFNTARTLNQYETGDKTAQFAVANSDDVIRELFAPAAQATKQAKAVDYSDYDRVEPSMWATPVDGEQTKAASGERELDVSGLTMDNQANRVFDIVRTQKEAAEQAQSVARQLRIYSTAELMKAAAVLKRCWFEQAVDRYARVKLAFAHDADYEGYLPLFEELHSLVPRAVALEVTTEKLASYQGVIDNRDLVELAGYIKQARDYQKEADSLDAEGGDLHKEACELEATFVGLSTGHLPKEEDDPLARFFKRGADSDRVSSVTEVKGEPVNLHMMSPEERQKALKMVTMNKVTKTEPPLPPKETKSDSSSGVMGKQLDSLLDRGTTSLVDSLGRSMSEPISWENTKMTERLRNVQRGVILQDLMINDPVLSEADPRAIEDAYAAILELSPTVSTNKEVIRAILRQAVHSVAISPYDANDWVKLEKGIQDVRTPNQPKAPNKEKE